LKIDPFANNFISKEIAIAPSEQRSVNLTKTLIDSFRKKNKSQKGDAKSRARSVKSFATMEDTWS
jgi:hypothetical protein